ncbi:hypothetical protein CPB86DRAFT_786100 [Serendipita vermifera]|nr:hypothetical protein CPB86DRAFT_786100 [Serendipita vermifera]
MSGGYYQLLRTNSEDGDKLEGLDERGTPLLASVRPLWFRIRDAVSPTKYSYKSILSPRRLSRDSDTTTSSNSSILQVGRQCSTRRRHPRNRLVLVYSVIVGLIISFAIYGAHRDEIDSFYYEQFKMVTPGAACLADQSSPESYVLWSPSTWKNRAIYHCITQKAAPLAPGPFSSPRGQLGSTLRPYRPLPSACLDDYYTNGTICSDWQRTKFDIIWTWVNGSDAMITRARRKALKALAHSQLENPEEEDEGADDDGDEAQEEANAHLYRDHDELKHSLRSVLQNFRESTKKFIILTSDFEFPVSYSPLKYLLGLDKRSTVPQQDVSAKQRKRKRSLDSSEQPPSEELEEDLEEDEEPFAFARLGLLPQWLRFDGISGGHSDGAQAPGQWRDGDVQLEVVHHAEVYEEYDGTVFNSNSIESQLGNLAGNEAFIYFNDDCFFASPLSSADFHTQHYGLVFRLIAYPFLLLNPVHYPTGSGTGEWRPMQFTNWLISERFGYRRRPYTMHQVKVLQGGLMREMWESWREQEAINRDHKFRGLGGLDEVLPDESKDNDVDALYWPPKPQPPEEDDDVVGTTEQLKRMIKRHVEGRDEPVANTTVPSEEQQARRKQGGIVEDDEQDTGRGPMVNEKGLVDDGDAHVMFLFTHFVVERSREAMLWSWIVATLGGDRDEFGITQRNQAWKTLVEDTNSELRNHGIVEVLVEKRKTTEPWRIQWSLDRESDTLKASEYLFSSQDGYAYSYYDQKKGLEWWHDESTWWPTLYNGDHFYPEPKDRPEWSKCSIDWNVCFGSEMSSASEIFKRIAFEKIECGDCILKALVKASGDLGLSALLPPADRVYRTENGGTSETETPPSPIPIGDEDVPPHLPLTSHWKTANFSLPAVFASGYWDKDGNGVGLREWVQRMLERYRYVIADTKNLFSVIHNPTDAEKTFAQLDDRTNVALVTINDDLNEKPQQTDARMREWFDYRWSTPAAWEEPNPAGHAPQGFDWPFEEKKRR